MPLSCAERARKSAQAMWDADAASKWAGMSLGNVAPGRATLSLLVESHHCNGHGICHGGVIFLLADSAFAFACNSYNQCAVAQHNNITFCAPGRVDETLTATAAEVNRAGRSGVYDVTIVNQDGTLIAVMRGHSRVIKGVHFQETNNG